MNGFTLPTVHDKNADREPSGHLLGIAEFICAILRLNGKADTELLNKIDLSHPARNETLMFQDKHL